MLSRFVLALGAVLVLSATVPSAATAQTRYFDGRPSAEDLERALTPPAEPPAARAAPPGAGAQPPGAAPFASRAAPPPPPERPKIGLMIAFAYGSAELTADARATLDVLAAAMARLPQFRFQVEGHTDAAGSDAYNLTLSQRRAAAVVQYLVLSHDIGPARLAAIGFGERKLRDPLRPNDGINRRVEILNLGPV
ncbi:MAG: OmpA family protein [Alphaproteobacteria bacterium]|nr:OmpA family protein [Alphaproteobacteria bacterium]